MRVVENETSLRGTDEYEGVEAAAAADGGVGGKNNIVGATPAGEASAEAGSITSHRYWVACIPSRVGRKP